MDDVGPDVGVCDGLLEGPSGELEGDAVRVHDAALRVGLDEMLGKGVDDRSELALVLPDTLLGPLAVVDVGAGGVPAYDPPRVVAQRGDTNEEPSVLTVSIPEARFRLPRSGLGKSALPSRRERIDVVRVCVPPDDSPSHVFERQPVVVEHDLVAVEARPVRCDNRDMMRNQLDDLSQLAFPLADPFFCLLAIFDVDTRSVPFHDGAARVAERHFAVQDPAILSIRPPHA